MGNQSKLKKNRKNGFDTVLGVHSKHLSPGTTILDLSTDFTNHNCVIASHFAKQDPEGCNILLVIDHETGLLAEIMPNETGFIPWDDYEKTKQCKQMISEGIGFGVAGMKLNPADPDSFSDVLSLLGRFMPINSANQVFTLIRNGVCNGMKWIILKDDSQNIRCCLHPDYIKRWNDRCI